MNLYFVSDIDPNMEFHNFGTGEDNELIQSLVDSGKITQGLMDSIVANPDSYTNDEIKKEKGFDYNGTQVSATKYDQDGLLAVIAALDTGLLAGINLHLKNGKKVYLTPDNITDFKLSFLSFRQQFFVD